MRALLITLAGTPATPSWFMPDNGLAQLAACLIEAGHDVEVLDLNTLEVFARLAKAAAPEEVFDALGREVAERVARDRPGLVGLKLWNGDGFDASCRIAAAIRARAGDAVRIVGGGPQVDFFGAALVRDPGAAAFDAFSLAEGEPTVMALADHLAGRLPLERVPNLLLRAASGSIHETEVVRVPDLDALPLAVYDEAIYPRAGKLPLATYEETRGCPYSCAFCNHPIKAGNSLRRKSVHRAATELRALVRRHGFRGFKLGGSFTPSAYLRELATEIIRGGPRIPFCGYGRLNDAKDADFPLFRAAGCEALFFGLESGSQTLLDRKIHKGFRVPAAVAVLQACKAAGIFTIASTVYPNPGETAETRRATLEVIAAARPDGAPVHFPVLIPGSGWFERPGSYGFALEDKDEYVRIALRYKARLLYPPEHWPPLPYAIDGKPYRQFAAETAAFAREVEALGTATNVSDEAALIARLAGEEPRVVRDRMRRAFVEGDVAAVEGLISKVLAGRAQDVVNEDGLARAGHELAGAEEQRR